MNEMTSYAASLTGAKGKALDAETITVGTKKLVKLEEDKPSKPEKSVPKSKKDESKEVSCGHPHLHDSSLLLSGS